MASPCYRIRSEAGVTYCFTAVGRHAGGGPRRQPRGHGSAGGVAGAVVAGIRRGGGSDADVAAFYLTCTQLIVRGRPWWPRAIWHPVAHEELYGTWGSTTSLHRRRGLSVVSTAGAQRTLNRALRRRDDAPRWSSGSASRSRPTTASTRGRGGGRTARVGARPRADRRWTTSKGNWHAVASLPRRQAARSRPPPPGARGPGGRPPERADDVVVTDMVGEEDKRGCCAGAGAHGTLPRRVLLLTVAEALTAGAPVPVNAAVAAREHRQRSGGAVVGATSPAVL